MTKVRLTKKINIFTNKDLNVKSYGMGKKNKMLDVLILGHLSNSKTLSLLSSSFLSQDFLEILM